MNVSEKVFFDTAPFIYLIENHPEFYQKTEELIFNLAMSSASFYTSVLTETEFNVQPIKLNKRELIDDFEKILVDIGFKVHNIDIGIAKKAAELRVKHGLKTLDALQVATAIESDCSVFVTNDKGLKRLSELKVILISEL